MCPAQWDAAGLHPWPWGRQPGREELLSAASCSEHPAGILRDGNMETWRYTYLCTRGSVYWSKSLRDGILCNDAYWCEVLLSLPGEVYP